MHPKNNKHSDPQIKPISETMTAMTMSSCSANASGSANASMPTLYTQDLSIGLSTINLTPPTKKRKRITFFDGDNEDKPRPAVTAIYDREDGTLLSVKTFDEERADEEAEYQAWLAERREKKPKKKRIEEAKTEEQDMEEALDELSFNPLDVANLLGGQ